MLTFQKATKKQARLRLALIGPSGSGKTYSALRIASNLANGGKVADIDTEHGSASKYADIFEFDTLELDTFSPQTYIDAIHAAEQAGYSVLIIDSLSHAWVGKEGALELVDRAAKRSQSGNTFTAWRDVTPLHNALVDTMLQSDCHIIATMRAKTEYVIEEDSRGKKVPRKIGMAPVQRDGLEYEFDVVADMDMDNNMIVSKTRCPVMSGQVYGKPGEDVAKILLGWLSDGAKPIPQPQPRKTQEVVPNGKAERPYPPEVMKERLASIRAEAIAKGWTVKENTAQVVAMNLEECFAGVQDADYRRHVLTHYLTGHESLKDLDAGWLYALKKWLNPQQDSGGAWAPDPMTVREAQAAYAEAERAKGQMELALEKK